MQIALLLATTLFPGATAWQSPPTPRRPLAPEPVQAIPLPDSLDSTSFRLVVKFHDALRTRTDSDGSLLSAVDLNDLRQFVNRENLRFRPLIELPASKLDALEQRAANRSGRSQPDLGGMLIVEVPAETNTTAELEDLGRRLQARDEIEWASIETLGTPPPGDLAPPTNNFESLQTYFGVNALNVAAVQLAGIDGSGVRLSDCEYGWENAHEDLNDQDLHLEPGQTPHPSVAANGWDEHGTAVIGMTSSTHNVYGCKGLAPGAEIYTYPEWTTQGGFRRLTAITNAIANSSPGDVVMLEMQTTGAGGGYGPAELNLSVWTVCQAGVDSGVIVVGAAGNGAQDLDSAPYAPYMARGDSGAILVGAGSPSSHSALSFSTYGSRVNLQGWGSSVMTLGYGTHVTVGGDDLQDYSNSFSGTSSATPMVAAGATLLQSAHKAAGGLLSPGEVRDALILFGTPQSGTKHIGPLPDVAATIEGTAPCTVGTSFCVSSVNSTGVAAELAGCGSLSVSANDLELRVEHMPLFQPGLIYYGQNQILVPFGNGFRCVGGITARLPVGAADANGTLFTQLDVTMPPSASTQIQAGSTWQFQGWYRDPAGGGAQFNLSQGLSLSFLP